MLNKCKLLLDIMFSLSQDVGEAVKGTPGRAVKGGSRASYIIYWVQCKMKTQGP